jgi:hypothetical protein
LFQGAAHAVIETATRRDQHSYPAYRTLARNCATVLQTSVSPDFSNRTLRIVTQGERAI